jgi:hypothetical protein
MSGDALVQVLLYLWTRLRKKSGGEIKSFFREMVSFERIGRIAVRSRKPAEGYTYGYLRLNRGINA